ncbi:MAG: hypothetical protein U0Q16_35415 [Bryobacteraceae bacterium]
MSAERGVGRYLANAPAHTALVIAAEAVVVSWALFWMAFGAAGAWNAEAKWTALAVHVTLPGLVFLAAALVALRWPGFGGELLVGLGVIVALLSAAAEVRNPLTKYATTVLLALPPLVAGSFFLVDARFQATAQERLSVSD